MQGTKYPKRPGPAGAVGPPPEANPEPPAQPSLHPNLQTAKMWVGIEPAPEYNFASRLRGPGAQQAACKLPPSHPAACLRACRPRPLSQQAVLSRQAHVCLPAMCPPPLLERSPAASCVAPAAEA